ncbi:MAG: heavy metal-binding domain-containing protein [Candidatus Dormibacteraceae bacterium]
MAQVTPPSGPGIPQQGVDRLRRMAGAGGGSFFTSDLSVNEFLLTKEAGFEPLGLVVGSSIYHIGYQVGNWNQNMELQVLSQAMYAARELAMTRMEAEAEQLGADGIIGVRLNVGFYEWGEGLAEFVAIGTAVKAREPGSYRTPAGKPFTSDLSGQDFWTLLQAGYIPRGLVMGTCVYHVAHQNLRGWFNTVGQNQEMPNFTQAVYEARELAMDRMQYEAMQLEADGVVGTQIVERPYYWGAHVIEFFAIGNAVKSLRPDHTIAKPQLTLPLQG